MGRVEAELTKRRELLKAGLDGQYKESVEEMEKLKGFVMQTIQANLY